MPRKKKPYEPPYKKAERLKREELAKARAKRREDQAKNMVVYFIVFPFSDDIKIGTTVNLEQRLRTFRTVAEPTVLCITPGGYELERELHVRFAAYRGYGEYFHPNPELMDLIQDIQDGTYGLPQE